ncbi:hypothetical protein J7U46_22480 [Pelomonas sp. V22]|uniref:hypothetical protein n=1 Tax=Pelomonas sp. V22 TaxID=2822139 RepID=UPI0024A91551|nr:hypothetical protein [Pelomonas sp. V22]MDI4635850.1 hypothetical protein [Pelomonas sp. V22]
MAIQSARYQFTRGEGIAVVMARESASTDAVNALEQWQGAHARRSYTFKMEEDSNEQLIATLSWDEEDAEAGHRLQAKCVQRGVSHTFIELVATPAVVGND